MIRNMERGMKYSLFNLSAAAATLVSCLLFAPGCSRGPAPESVYSDNKFNAAFDIPQGWSYEHNIGVLGETSFNSPSSDAVFYYKAVRDQFFYFIDVGSLFQSFVQITRLSYPDLIVLTNSLRQAAGTNAVFFEGMMDKKNLSGFLAKRETDAFIFAFQSSAPSADLAPEIERLAASLKLPPSEKADELVVRMLRQLPAIKDLAAASNAVNYGNELLSARNANVRYFNGALRQFAAALNFMSSVEPLPPEHEDALSYLALGIYFRYQAYLDASHKLESAIGLGMRANAKDAAQFIMELYPERTSTQFRYAARKWNQALDLKFGE